MATPLSAPRGTRDILPEEAARWHRLEAIAREIFTRYRYREIRTPLIEPTELFARGIGEGTDIVGKEMYTFQDKGDRSLTLRPENTAGVMRAYLEHKLFASPGPHKLWYWGPMFRYERPASGRQRQFHQLGIECLGVAEPRSDAEAILLAVDFLTAVGLGSLEVQINSVGCEACRPHYRARLVEYLQAHQETLCETCRVRTEKNPLRVLDCKVPSCQPILQAAPPLPDSLCEGCREHHVRVGELLALAGVRTCSNERLVRGLDYYARTVFEVCSKDLGAQNTVLAGGRYNQLATELGGPPTPAIGWAAGIERLLLLMPPGEAEPPLEAMIVARGEAAEQAGFLLAWELRQCGLSVEQAQPAKLDKQFKQAERQGARWALVIGEDELSSNTVTVKELATRQQARVARSEVAMHLTAPEPSSDG